MNHSDFYDQRLIREIQTLQRCENRTGLRAKPIIDQLIADSDRPLPDVFPSSPRWVEFDWPASGEVSFVGYWRNYDYNRQ